MQGPDVAWYLVVAAILFSIGTAGVLLRRSPLIVLLSLEIMLNAGNLALISFARLHGDHDGQIFALAVMAVAASEVVVGLGLIVAIARQAARPRRRPAAGAARMIAGAWICLLAPLCGALLITLLGGSISRRTAAWLSTVSVFTAFGGASPRSSACSAATPRSARSSRPPGRGSRRRTSRSASRCSSTRSR